MNFSVCALCVRVCARVYVCMWDTAATEDLWWKYSKAIVDLHRPRCTAILVTHALSLSLSHTQKCRDTFGHTHPHTHSPMHAVRRVTETLGGDPDACGCAWTSGGFDGSTLSSCYCANHPLVQSSEFKSSRVHRKNKICSPFSQVVNYAYKPNIHI